MSGGDEGVTGAKTTEPVNKRETPIAQRRQMAMGASSGRLIQETSGIRGAWGGFRNRPGMDQVGRASLDLATLGLKGRSQMSPSVFSCCSESRFLRSTMVDRGMAETASNALQRSRTELLGQELGRIRRTVGAIQGSSALARQVQGSSTVWSKRAPVGDEVDELGRHPIPTGAFRRRRDPPERSRRPTVRIFSRSLPRHGGSRRRAFAAGSTRAR
jgi:hypothetical protein